MGAQQSIGLAAIGYLTTGVEDDAVILAVLRRGLQVLACDPRPPRTRPKTGFLEATRDSKTTAGGQEHEPNNRCSCCGMPVPSYARQRAGRAEHGRATQQVSNAVLSHRRRANGARAGHCKNVRLH